VRPTRALAFSLAALAGVVAGWQLAERHLERHKADLFSSSRLRRLAALSYLAGREGPEVFQALSDYVVWEPSPTLRRRAERQLKRMERSMAIGDTVG